MERKSLVVSQGNTWKHFRRDTKGAFRRDTGSPGPFLRARRGKRWAEAHSTWLCCGPAQGNVLEPLA